ncbi:hypothetical protein LSAT2_024491, partial [Lamellibrachia satsuma]
EASTSTTSITSTTISTTSTTISTTSTTDAITEFCVAAATTTDDVRPILILPTPIRDLPSVGSCGDSLPSSNICS